GPRVSDRLATRRRLAALGLAGRGLARPRVILLAGEADIARAVPARPRTRAHRRLVVDAQPAEQDVEPVLPCPARWPTHSSGPISEVVPSCQDSPEPPST